MDQAQLTSQFQDLNQRLFEAFQQLGLVLRDLKLQLDDIKGAVAVQHGGSRAASPGGQISADDLQQGFQLIAQRLAVITRDLGDLKAGGLGAPGPDPVLTERLTRLPLEVEQSVRTGVSQLQRDLELQRLQEAQSQPQLEPRLAAIEAAVGRLAEQGVQQGDGPDPVQSVRDAVEQIERALELQRLQDAEAARPLDAALNARLETLEQGVRGLADQFLALSAPETLTDAVHGVASQLEALSAQTRDRGDEQWSRLSAQAERTELTLQALRDELARQNESVEASRAALHPQLEQIAVALRGLPETVTSAELGELEQRLGAALAEIRGALDEGRAADLRPEFAGLAEKLDHLTAAQHPTPDLTGLEERLSAQTSEIRSAVEAAARAQSAEAPELAEFGKRLDRFLSELRDAVTSALASGARTVSGESEGAEPAPMLSLAALDRLRGVETQLESLGERLSALLATLDPTPRLAELAAAQTATSVAIGADLGRLEATLRELRETVEHSVPDPAPAIDALRSELSARLEQLTAAPSSPATDMPQPVDDERFRAFEARLEALSAKIDAWTPVDPTPALTSLAASVEARMGRLEALLQTAPQGPAPDEARTDAMEERLSGLESGISGLRALLEQALAGPAPTPPAPVEDLPDVRAAVATLAERLDQLLAVDPVPAIRTLAVNVSERFERLEKLAQPKGETQQLTVLDRKMDALDRRLASMPAPQSASTSVSSLAAILERRLDQLEATLRTIPAGTAPSGPVTPAPPTHRVPPRPPVRDSAGEPDLDALLLD